MLQLNFYNTNTSLSLSLSLGVLVNAVQPLVCSGARQASTFTITVSLSLSLCACSTLANNESGLRPLQPLASSVGQIYQIDTQARSTAEIGPTADHGLALLGQQNPGLS